MFGRSISLHAYGFFGKLAMIVFTKIDRNQIEIIRRGKQDNELGSSVSAIDSSSCFFLYFFSFSHKVEQSIPAELTISYEA
jgi:hypothetical protein